MESYWVSCTGDADIITCNHMEVGVGTCPFVHVCINMCTWLCVHACMFVYVCMFVYECSCICACACVCACMTANVIVPVFVYVYMRVCLHTCIGMYMLRLLQTTFFKNQKLNYKKPIVLGKNNFNSINTVFLSSYKAYMSAFVDSVKKVIMQWD